MNKENSFYVSRERHLILLGQIGNLRARINRAKQIAELSGHHAYIAILEELSLELEFLEQYLPSLSDDLPF